MKIKDGFVLRKIGGKDMAVPVGERTREVHGMIALNETGAFLWENLSEERTEEELTRALLDEYEVDQAVAARAVEGFVRKLRENGVLEDE
ncbi:MAG: PqqD family protein [Lachnospiraceae bacterium]|nr:PqqD family protein [Lachnospiraceae bacterium]